MYVSKVLGKSYKTKAAYKAQLTKYKKFAASELKHIQDMEKRGARLYLGDPIAKHRRAWEVEELLIARELRIIKYGNEVISIDKK